MTEKGVMIFYLVIFGLIIFLLIILSFVWPPDSPWAPWWKIKRDVAIKVCRFIKLKKSDVVYELGSGDGEFVIVSSKEFGVKSVGIEIDPLRFLISKFRVLKDGLGDKVTLNKKNFYDVDLSPATIIFAYLVPRALSRLLPKLKKELKKGTKIISYRYQIPLSKNEKKIKLISENKKLEIFVYEINKSK